MPLETKGHNAARVQKRNATNKQNRKRSSASEKDRPNANNLRRSNSSNGNNKSAQHSSGAFGWSLLIILAGFLAAVYLIPVEDLERYALTKRISRSVRSYVGRRQAGGFGSPTAMPTNWPSIDQLQLINGALLTDPLVTNAMDIVKKTVPAELLNIPPSTYINGPTVTYNADVNKYCYWPATGCKRTIPGNGYIEDVFTCPTAGDWGISYAGNNERIQGPTTETPKLRTLLDSMNLKATFFVAGSNVMQFPNEVTLHDKSGHQVAGHTWTHHPLTSLTNEQIVAEIKYTEAIVYKTIGKRMAYLRPPYGDYDDRVRAIANALGYRIAIWDQDSNDTSGAPTTLDVIKSWFNLKTGFVSLEHDITAGTTQFAVDALKAIQALGATFPLKIQPVATCNNHIWYNYVATTGKAGGGPTYKFQQAENMTTTTTASTTAAETSPLISPAPQTQTMKILQVSPSPTTTTTKGSDAIGNAKSNAAVTILAILGVTILLISDILVNLL
ncbi:chitin deacetylase [Nowakowskiella sp. JEL0407]|nr:chitin deacetylase [Nowakowskiella sp. JEL0407]